MTERQSAQKISRARLTLSGPKIVTSARAAAYIGSKEARPKPVFRSGGPVHRLPKSAPNAANYEWIIFTKMQTQTEPDKKKYGRFPDVDRIFSIKRSKTYELLNAGKIRSAVIKQKGARSGVRLIDLQSVEEFLKKNTVTAERPTKMHER